MNNISAFHYSSKPLNIGDKIFSNQHKAKTYQLFWPIYNEVCQNLLKKEFPKEFGYAYPVEKKHIKSGNKYLVQGDKIITGNFNHSIYLMMECLDSSWKDIKPLSERLEARRQLIERSAIKYFTKIDDVNQCELISPNWIVIEHFK